MSIAFALSVAVTSSVLAAGPVQSYSRSPDPSRSEGLRSARPFLPIADPRPGDRLLSPAPWPDNRTDDPRREQNGRLWYPRVKVGTRSPLAELPLGTPGAASFGAPPEGNDQLIFVRSSLRLPIVAISPFVDVDARTTDEIEREVPLIGRVPTKLRSAQILRELKEAQLQWLKEEGYILSVRTHANPAAIIKQQQKQQDAGGEHAAADDAAESPEPRAIMKIRERGTGEPPTPIAEDSDTDRATITNASASKPRKAPIVIVRQAQPTAAQSTSPAAE